MNATKSARRLLKAEPSSEAAKTIAGLVLALQSEEGFAFPIASIYQLDLKTFELAMELMQDWRIERYFTKKSKLYAQARVIHGLAPADSVEHDEAE